MVKSFGFKFGYTHSLNKNILSYNYNFDGIQLLTYYVQILRGKGENFAVAMDLAEQTTTRINVPLLTKNDDDVPDDHFE